MIFIITIDDAEVHTIENLLKENIDIPLVVGIPAGLIGKKLENIDIAHLDLLKETIKKLDLEIASHGYFHTVPKLKKSEYCKIFLSRLIHHPDKVGYLSGSLRFIKKCNTHDNNRSLVNYELYREIVASKRLLSEKFGKEPITFAYPGGYVSKDIFNMVRTEYSFARTSEIGINTLINNKCLLKTISITNLINVEKLEKYYDKISSKERGNKEYLIIETYHQLLDNDKKIKNIYDIKLDNFMNHCNRIRKFGSIVNFEYLKKY